MKMERYLDSNQNKTFTNLVLLRENPSPRRRCPTSFENVRHYDKEENKHVSRRNFNPCHAHNRMTFQ